MVRVSVAQGFTFGFSDVFRLSYFNFWLLRLLFFTTVLIIFDFLFLSFWLSFNIFNGFSGLKKKYKSFLINFSWMKQFSLAFDLTLWKLYILSWINPLILVWQTKNICCVWSILGGLFSRILPHSIPWIQLRRRSILQCCHLQIPE